MRKKFFACFFSLNLFIVLMAMSCTDDANEVDPNPSLSIDETTIPATSLSSKAGEFTIGVSWAFTIVRVSLDETIEGSPFISEVSPSYFGDEEMEGRTTEVRFVYENNDTYSVNKQRIVVRSPDGSLADTFVVSQLAKEVEPFDITLDASKIHQSITGFGGANAIWGTDYLNQNEMELAFGTGDKGLGLSIFRVRLSSSKSDWPGLVNTVTMANSYGAKVLASPWSPPAEWKSNNSVNGGGYLLEDHYADFATYINDFIQYMADANATVDVVSVQNEPDWKVSYEGCEYTVNQMFNFVKNQGHMIQGAKLMVAESLNSNQAYTTAILNDAVVADNIDIIGGHLYGSGNAPYPLAAEKQKEVWMTEHLLNLDSGNNPELWTQYTDPVTIWNETMQMVDEIHAVMCNNWNAYIWWYIRRYYSFLGDGEKGTTRGEILKRGFAYSQFSKFIRPGYVRIDAEVENSTAGVKATAYTGDGKTVVVIINDAYSIVPQANLIGLTGISAAVAYTTSLEKDREAIILDAANNGGITLDLDARSVTTVVIEF
ncbi:glycoside hydrolase [Geofilum sp. OHC36d9]|uniref:glycoside hydrolase n=1 Tax=Geofilum sp. OHC36d9 TaxID=3458413 RepID=UPI00403344E5